MDHRAFAARRADQRRIGLLRIGAFEDDRRSLGHQQAFDAMEQFSRRLVGGKMQPPAMRRVENPCLPAPIGGETGIEAALGAMSVDNVHVQSSGQCVHGEGRGQVCPSKQSRHGKAVDTQAGIGFQCREQGLGLRVIGEAVDHDAYLVALAGEGACQVGHVWEQSTHGCTQYLQDAQVFPVHA